MQFNAVAHATYCWRIALEGVLNLQMITYDCGLWISRFESIQLFEGKLKHEVHVNRINFLQELIGSIQRKVASFSRPEFCHVSNIFRTYESHLQAGVWFFEALILNMVRWGQTGSKFLVVGGFLYNIILWWQLLPYSGMWWNILYVFSMQMEYK